MHYRDDEGKTTCMTGLFDSCFRLLRGLEFGGPVTGKVQGFGAPCFETSGFRVEVSFLRDP